MAKNKSELVEHVGNHLPDDPTRPHEIVPVIVNLQLSPAAIGSLIDAAEDALAKKLNDEPPLF